MKHLALVGLSGYARTHVLMALEQTLGGKSAFRAITVINPETEAFFCRRLSALGCELFSSTEEMWRVWAGRIDLCLIPTGIHLHAPMTIEALRAGANVLVEKPLAGTPAEVDAVEAAAESTGRFAAIAFQDLYTPAAQEIKRRLLAGEFGRMRSATVVGLWPRPRNYYTRNDWAGRVKVGGATVNDSPVSNAFAHFINLALFWAADDFAAIARVASLEAELWRTQAIESFDTAALHGVTGGGVELHAYVSHASNEPREAEIVVETEHAQLHWRHLTRCEINWRDGRRETLPLLGSIEARLTMMDSVMARLDRPDAFVCTPAMARAHVELVARLHAATEIRDFPSEGLESSGPADNPRIAIRGLEALFDRAARTRLLPGEVARVAGMRSFGVAV